MRQSILRSMKGSKMAAAPLHLFLLLLCFTGEVIYHEGVSLEDTMESGKD